MAVAAVSRSPGFTLIELMIVVLVIGILSSMALANVAAAKERAYKAQMRADLRQLVIAEEYFYQDTEGRRRGSRYTRNLSRLDFTPTDGVSIRIRASRNGWSARARHSSLPRRDQCAIVIGSIRAFPPASDPGVPACR